MKIANAGYKRKRISIPIRLRIEVIRRDKSICRYCGTKLFGKYISIDHVTPIRLGGKTTFENLVVSCVGCNVKKGGNTPSGANMPLIPLIEVSTEKRGKQ